MVVGVPHQPELLFLKIEKDKRHPPLPRNPRASFNLSTATIENVKIRHSAIRVIFFKCFVASCCSPCPLRYVVLLLTLTRRNGRKGRKRRRWHRFKKRERERKRGNRTLLAVGVVVKVEKRKGDIIFSVIKRKKKRGKRKESIISSSSRS